MTKNCGAGLCIVNLMLHFFVSVPAILLRKLPVIGTRKRQTATPTNKIKRFHALWYFFNEFGKTFNWEYYVNCGYTNEMKVWSSQLCLRFKQSQLSPKNVFGTSTGFEPKASALALQCSTNWAMKTHMLGAGQFVEIIVPVKGMFRA